MIREFHSHLEPMKRIKADEIGDQISFSYIDYNGVKNALDIPEGPFPNDVDPTRYKAIFTSVRFFKSAKVRRRNRESGRGRRFGTISL